MNKVIVIVAFIAIAISTFAQSLVLNEIQTDNVNTIVDEDGDRVPWIEIFNGSSKIINLQDYGLSNDLMNPFRWTFPYMEITPGEFLLVFASGKDRNIGEPLHWETIINRGDQWSYKKGDASISPNWYQLNFNDNSWATGPSGFGYGDGDDQTVVGSASQPLLTLYIRKTFSIKQIEDVADVVMHLDFDDGFVAYLNGNEVARANISVPTPKYNTSASTGHEAEMYRDGAATRFNLGKEFLKQGNNVLAIEVHNRGQNSSDLSLIPYLTLLLNSPPAIAKETPDELSFTEQKCTLHTNFILPTEGGTVILSTPSGLKVDTLIALNIPKNASKGLNKEGSVITFATPSPGSANLDASKTYGKLDKVHFSLESGFYKDAINLRLSNTDTESVIRYTTDGSDPTARSKVFTEQFRINKTSIIKAIATGALQVSSEIESKVYFINNKHRLPVISITHKQSDFFSTLDGIYTDGDNAAVNWPHTGANYWNDIQRKVKIDYFDAAGACCFETEANASIYDSESRTYPQKSLSIELLNNNVEYELFPNQKVSSLNSFVLSNGDDDWANTLLNESFMQSLVGKLDLDLRHRKPCIVYLNGNYWGIHELREEIDKVFIANRSKINETKVALLNYDMKQTPSTTFGTSSDYLLLWNKTNVNSTFSNSKITELAKSIDINNYFNYIIFQIYIANTQWPGKNQTFWHSGLTSGKWRWIPDDFDRGFGVSLHGDNHYAFYNQAAYMYPSLNKILKTGTTQSINPYYSTLFIRKILTNELQRQQFINRFADLLNTVFLPSQVDANCDFLAEQIEPEIDQHFNKWETDLKSNFPPEWNSSLEWDKRVESLKDFGKKRHAEMFKQLSDEFSISPKKTMLKVSVNNPSAGSIQLNSLRLSVFPWEGRYFEDVPISVTAIAKEGYKFIGWKGSEEFSPSIEYILGGNDNNLTALFEQSNTSTAPEVVINEINYHSSSTNGGEWIELYNASGTDVNLNAWRLTCKNGGPDFEFPANFILGKGSYVVVCENISRFVINHPGVYNILGEADYVLSDSENMLSLLNETGALIDSVNYSSGAPWPAAANIITNTLALKSPFGDNNYSYNWDVSDGYGTPGKANYEFYTSLRNQDKTNELSAWPNPFKERVYIKAGTTEHSPVTLRFFNAQGTLVDVKNHVIFSQGDNRFEWFGNSSDGTPLSSGIYFCEIESLSKKQTIKLQIIR